MGRTKTSSDLPYGIAKEKKRPRPATTTEEQENRCIALALSLAEQQLRDGTASAQVITHFLDANSAKTKAALDRATEELKLIKAKTGQIEQQKNMTELYAKAMESMKVYAGEKD